MSYSRSHHLQDPSAPTIPPAPTPIKGRRSTFIAVPYSCLGPRPPGDTFGAESRSGTSKVNAKRSRFVVYGTDDESNHDVERLLTKRARVAITNPPKARAPKRFAESDFDDLTDL